MNANNIMSTAVELTQQHSKKTIAGLCRSMGWKGDDARTPLLQLAVWLATKMHEQDTSGEEIRDSGQSREGEHNNRGDEAKGQQQQDQQDPQQGNGDEGNDGRPPVGQQESQQGNGGEGNDEGQQGNGGEQGDDGDEGNEQGDDGQPQQGDEGQQEPQQGDEGQPQQGDEGQPQQEPQGEREPEENEPPEDTGNSAEFLSLLKASGISKPHYQLEKLWRLTAKAGLNVMLVGPAGCGKTMLSEQLAVLTGKPFSSISCSAGMSESQLTGWLLPVGEAGKFDYVPSPFVQAVQQSSVYMIDEIDAGDSNVFMVLNSITANGFITIPHKLKNPTIRRHVDSILVAGANTCGNGGNDLYNARGALDGAFADRWYLMAVDYDTAYEHGLYAFARKSTKKTPMWTPAADWTADNAEHLRKWAESIRFGQQAHDIGRIVGTRFHIKLIAAVKAGVSMNEAKADLLMAWTRDERNLVNAGV